MKIFNLLFVLLIASSLYSQQKQTVRVISIDGGPVENVVVYNLTSKLFNYTDEKGKAELNYITNKDSVFIQIPGYKTKYFIAEEIFLNENKIILESYIEKLEEVKISTHKTTKNIFTGKKVKFKRKYFTELVSSGASIVSSYKHLKCTDAKLKELKIFVDKSKLKINDSIFVRPLIFLQNDDNFTNLLETPYSILLRKDENQEVIIKFFNDGIQFSKDEEYLIGFEIINRNNISQKISFRAGNVKNNYSLLKGNPNAKWTKISVGKYELSIDYELYFESCN